MEAIGLAASIISLLELGKKLRDVALTLVGKLPDSHTSAIIITSAVVLDLQAIQDCLGTNAADITTETGQELRDACSELELELAGCLDKCVALHAGVDSKMRRFMALLHGQTTADVLKHLQRVESAVTDLRRRFSMKGLMRIELAVTHASAMNEQFRAEINQRLDFIEEHLKLRISKAKADPSYADSLVGVARMSGTTMRSSIERASRDLEQSTSGIEAQYLRVKIQTLQDALNQYSPAPTTTDQIDTGNMCSTTHQYPVDDPKDQIEDVISQAIALLRALRSPDKAQIPFFRLVAGLEDLCKKMLDLGMYEDTRQTYVQITRMYRASIQDNAPPSATDAQLARAIIGLCAALSRLGNAEEALEHIKEAVAIFRYLSQHDTAYEAGLSVALNNMANYSRDAGMFMLALGIIDEAIALREKLAFCTPALYKPDLAASLLNASTCYGKVPYLHRQALHLAERAVYIARELMRECPGRFSPHLGAALHNRANRRLALWQNTLAYDDIKEAVEIRRRLAALRPDVYGGGLIRSLSVAKGLARRCQDGGSEVEFQAELQRLCKHSHNDLPIIAEPQIPLPPSIGQRYRVKIRYQGSGNLATPYMLATPTTCIDQIISPETGALLRPRLVSASLVYRA
ncbi:hypothetical protein B0H14DRAFT_2901512 [Mycena olivaceomarginata]|nr:hypothetical protein B0H14DRAFT_2901512 [Mycena olivaceomarginata]